MLACAKALVPGNALPLSPRHYPDAGPAEACVEWFSIERAGEHLSCR